MDDNTQVPPSDRDFGLASAHQDAAAAYSMSKGRPAERVYDWQAELYDRLSRPTEDAGLLLLTPTGTGRTDAVTIPSLGYRRGGAPRRLFLIGPDGSPLDDWVDRMTRYLRAWAAADQSERILFVAAEENVCQKFLPTGAFEPCDEVNPLEADVDLVLATLTRFRELFFGSGGIHALPSTLPRRDQQSKRDLFFFDEAHSYDAGSFSDFVRLVEFLYAQDTDVIVGSTTMPVSIAEEFSFLETVVAKQPDGHPAPTLRYRAGQNLSSVALEELSEEKRVLVVTETAEDAEEIYEILSRNYGGEAVLYHPGQEQVTRFERYLRLTDLQTRGAGYLAVTTGPAAESADFDAHTVITGQCSPESLIRRAGRCNRQGALAASTIAVCSPRPPADTSYSGAEYTERLICADGSAFCAEEWKKYVRIYV